MAPGYQPTFFAKVDPLKSPLSAQLKLRLETNLPPAHIIRGRVLDTEKQPIEGAVVSVEMVQQGNTGHGTPPNGTDPIAVTDEAGNFAIQSMEAFDSMQLRVDARGYARRDVNDVAGGKPVEFVVVRGAAVKGRVLRDGNPMQDVTIGLVSVDRSMGNFTGEFLIGTTESGSFVLPNIPPNREYYLYGTMGSLKGGTLPAKRIKVGADNSVFEAGTLTVTPGLHLSGEVKLASNEPIPPGTKVVVSLDEAWDSAVAPAAPDGHFEFTNLPPGKVTVSTRIEGFRLSRLNPSLDQLNPSSLTGKLVSDRTNFVILLERGTSLPSDYSNTEDRPGESPLASVGEKRVVAGAKTFPK